MCEECLNDLGKVVNGASINVFECSHFKNDDGVLVCDHDRLPENDVDAPPGSYLFKCGGCELLDEERILMCKQCKDTLRGLKQDVFTIVDPDCENYAYDSGELVCKEKKLLPAL